MRAVHKAAVLAVVLAGAAPVVAVPPAWADTMRDKQWYLKTLDIAAAHKITTGDGAVVAVLDTGVGAHPDIDGQVAEGVSFVGETSDPNSFRTDNDGHGSAMVGIIAAKGGNADHLLGIAPKAKILVVRSMLNGETFATSNILESVRWAVDHGAKVINISNGSDRVQRGTEEAIDYAIAHDVVVVAGSGNVSAFPDGSGVIAPARLPGVVAVSAVDRDGKAWDGAIRGPQVVLSAPGVGIPVVAAVGGLNLDPGYHLASNGTSNATAVVSGAAALIRAKYPQLPAKDVIQRLISTADDAGPPGRDPDYGFGRLNLVKALTVEVPAATANPLLPSPTAAGEAGGGGSGTGVSPLILAAGGFLVLLVSALAGWLLLRRRRA